MRIIDSFKVDHTKLRRGIYVSRKDYLGDDAITTFDIRMKEPNKEPAMNSSELHTIEHLAATFLRNHKDWGERIIYWGPMGCCTGYYLIIKGDLESKDIIPLIKELFYWIAWYDGEIPGANEHDCGNYLLNNLPMAKWEAAKFHYEVLEQEIPVKYC